MVVDICHKPNRNGIVVGSSSWGGDGFSYQHSNPLSSYDICKALASECSLGDSPLV